MATFNLAIEMGIKIQRRILVMSLLSALMSSQIVKADEMLRTSVSFSEAEPASSAPAKKIVKPKSHWYELRGSLNREYVYLIVKKTGQRQIEGYLFDSRGNRKFIYGEWFNRELQIYDRSNKRHIVILYD